MEYHENIDAYECTQGRYLSRRVALEEKINETIINRGKVPKPEQRIYQSFTGCKTYPVREECMKSAATRYDFTTLRVDTQLDIYRENAKKNIESDKGKRLRLNRSIQAEGSFAL